MRNEEVAVLLNSTDWNQVLDKFRGEIEQVPPMFSAKKVEGKKLYEHARKGETIDREPITVQIHAIEIIAPGFDIPNSALRIRVICSAGTYVRTLSQDIGREIRIPAHLAELRRTRSGKFTIGQSLPLEQLEELDDASSALLPMEQAVSHLPVMILPDERVERTKNGLSTRVSEAQFTDGQALQMQDQAGHLIAIGFFDETENSVQPSVVLG